MQLRKKRFLRRVCLFSLPAFLLLLAQSSAAQKPVDSLTFSTDGTVYATAMQGNDLYLGGSFNYVGKKTGTVAFFHNGSTMPDYSMPLFGMISPLVDGENSETRTIIPDGKGGWFVGGVFEKVNNRRHFYLVHILPDKQLDEGFNLPFKDNTGLGVYELKMDADYLYVAGYFTVEEGGNTYRNLFRINRHTLKPDASWKPDFGNYGHVDHLEITGDKIFLSGNFYLKSSKMYYSILALDKQTARPVSFPTTTTKNESSGNSLVEGPAIHLMGDTLFLGKLFKNDGVTNGFGHLSGGISFFDNSGNLLSDSVRNGRLYACIPDGNNGFYAAGKWRYQQGVFHIDENGQLINTFSQTEVRLFDILAAHLTCGNNSLYVTSAKYTQGVSISVNGKTIRSLFKLDAATGEIDTAFHPNPNGQVYVTLLKGDTLFVGGSFSEIGGVNRTGLAAVNANTGAVYDWDPSFNDTDGFFLGVGGHHVSDLEMVHDTLYAAGIFLTNSQSKTENISSLVRYNMADGGLDTTFHLSRERSGVSMPEFSSLAYHNGQLFFSGYFDMQDESGNKMKNAGVLNVKTLKINKISKEILLVGLKQQAFGAQGKLKLKVYDNILYLTNFIAVQLNPEKVVPYITAIDLSTGKLTSWSMAPSSPVYAFAVSGGKTLLSGIFDIVKWNSSEIAGVNVHTGKFIDFPTVIDVQHSVSFAHNDKYLFIGSGFELFGDDTVNGLVRLRRKDLSVTRFNHQISSDNGSFFIRDLAMGKGGLYVTGTYNTLSAASGHASGAFATVAGQPRQNICLLDPETAALKDWQPPHYNAHTCQVFACGDEVVLSGFFTMMPAYEHTKLAKIDLETGKIADWNPVVEDRWAVVETLLASGDTLFVGGKEISKISGLDAGNLSAVSTRTGTLLSGFAPPDMDGDVNSLFKKGGQLYATGTFKKVNTISHYHVARFSTATGAVDDWAPQLNEKKINNINALVVDDTTVYAAGGYIGIPGDPEDGYMVRCNTKNNEVAKLYHGGRYSTIASMARNGRGDIAVGLHSNSSDDNNFLILDKKRDTLLPLPHQPQFSDGIEKLEARGNYFLVAGNGMREFGKRTEKPGLFVYDPVKDTVTVRFSTPVMVGNIKTFSANNKLLVFAGNLGGMNGNRNNGGLAFMQMPDLQLKPGVTSWSPKAANTSDPFALAVYGSGFTQNSKLTLSYGGVIRQPDSLHIADNKMTAYFNGTDFTAGLWDLNVEIIPGSPLLFTKAMDISHAELADVWIDMTVPDVVRANKPATGYLTFGNAGNKAAYGVFIYLGIDESQVLELPSYVHHPDLPYNVDWDTVPRFIDVDYFLGEPYHGKVCVLFVPYMPAHFDFNMKLKLTTESRESKNIQVKYAIGHPLYDSYEELVPHDKSAQNIFYDAFRCVYDVVGIVADLTPGVGCIKSVFDNTVLAGMDKYMNNESVEVEDVTLSIGMIGLGCVPGGAEMSKAAEVTTTMVSKGFDYSGVFSSCTKLADSADKDSRNMRTNFSLDPNAKYGPAGKGTSVYFHTGEPYQYMVTFENDSAATAAAQRVLVIDTLDKNVFDLTSFQPLGFSFGDTAYFYKDTDDDTVNIDLRPEKDMIVQIFYRLSPEGILTWTFLTLDPNTYQLTNDAYAGFLPPDRTAPEGEGSVLYAISPLDGLADGTAINNSANIVFDWNETIPTDRWHNVTDNSLPESAVNALPAVTLDKNFTVSWSGNDPVSGIYAYAVYVAEGDSAYYAWLPETKDSSAVFSGEAGKTYKFYSIAIDSAGNREKVPVMYDAITQVSGTGIDNFGESQKAEIRIYPNPAHGQARLDYSLPEPGSLRIDLLNSCGHLVRELYATDRFQGKGTLRVDMSVLPAGFYFVRILTPHGVQTRKIMKR